MSATGSQSAEVLQESTLAWRQWNGQCVRAEPWDEPVGMVALFSLGRVVHPAVDDLGSEFRVGLDKFRQVIAELMILFIQCNDRLA